MRRWFLMVVLAAGLVAVPSVPAWAQGRFAGARADVQRERREKLLRRAHTIMVMELGDRLGLESAAVIQLTQRLKKFDDERVTLRLENLDLVKRLKAAGDKPSPEVVEAVKKIAANRVRLAQVDEAELNDLLSQVPPEKAAQVALFVGEFANRLERVAREAVRNRRGGDVEDLADEGLE